MEMVSVLSIFISAAVLGGVCVDWMNRKTLVKEMGIATEETRALRVEKKVYLEEIARLSDRISELEIKVSMKHGIISR